MMKSKPLFLLIIAGGCGLVAMWGAMQMSKKGQINTIEVATARADIEPYMLIDPTNIEWKSIPVATAPKGAVTDPAKLEGRGLKVKVVTGDYILEPKLAEKGQLGASAAIQVGMRAFTLPATATQSHVGMLRPGDRVDIFVTYLRAKPGSNVQEPVTKPVLEYVEVFAVGSTREGDSADQAGGKATKVETLTVQTTQEDCQKLAQAQRKGELSWSLRNRLDTKLSGVTTLTDEEFEDARASLGPQQAEPEVALTPEPGESPLPPVPSATVAEQVAEPEIWTIAIYEGENLREEKITLPPRPTDTNKESANVWTSLSSWLKSVGTRTPGRTSKVSTEAARTKEPANLPDDENTSAAAEAAPAGEPTAALPEPVEPRQAKKDNVVLPPGLLSIGVPGN